jgi:hypothetical protein
MATLAATVDRYGHRMQTQVSSEDTHRALLAGGQPKPKSLKQLKQGLRDYARKRYVRG